jgi:hypothetical protein
LYQIVNRKIAQPEPNRCVAGSTLAMLSILPTNADSFWLFGLVKDLSG